MKIGRAEALALGGAVGAGIVLRFVTESHLWLDEALSVDIARLPVREIPAALRHDGHPPLYYVLLHFWMRVFGESNAAVRSLSGIAGLGALLLVWFVARRVDRAAAPVAVGLFALLPFAIRYATETRMYSLVMLFVLAGYLLVVRALERPTVARLVPVSVIVGLLLLTHYWALWLTAAVIVVLGWYWWRTDARRVALQRVIIAVAAGGVFLLPWLPSMLTQSAHTGTPWAATVRPTTMVATSIIDVGGGVNGEGELLGFALTLLFLLGLFARRDDDGRIVLDARSRGRAARLGAVVGLTLLLAEAASYVSRTTFAPRYVAVVVPLFAIVAAVGATRIEGRTARDVVVLGVLLLGLVGGVHNVTTDRTQAGQIASAIGAELQPSDLVIVCPDQLGPSMRRVLPQADLVTYPDGGNGDRVDWYDYAKRNAAADPALFVTDELAHHPEAHVVWLVINDGYKTLEGQCAAVQQQLSARAATAATVLAGDDTTYFESAGLVRFQLAAGA